MGKAKPISLHPLSFEEAIKAIVKVDPERIGHGKHKHDKAKPKEKKK